MNETFMMPAEQQRFNPIDALVGVIIRPVVTMQKIAAARPWRTALVILVVVAVLGSLVGLTTPVQPNPLPADADVPAGLTNLVALSQSRVPAIVGGLLGPFFQIAYAGILFLIARLLGGEGHFSALFSTLVFASIPSILLLPLTLISNLSGVIALSFIVAALAFAVSIWGIVLHVFGVREAMRLSTGRAVATVLIPIGIIMFLACAFVILVVGLAILGLRSVAS
jgi:hypothetical protein